MIKKVRIKPCKLFLFILLLIFFFTTSGILPGNIPAIAAMEPGTITTVVGNGIMGYSGDGGPATSAQLCSPNGMTLDSTGNLYIADGTNNRIRKVDAQGTITTVVGNGAQGYSGDGGPATSAEMHRPSDIVLSSAGNLYIADSGNNRIRKVDAQGTITTVVGNGAQGYSGDGGPATSAKLAEPRSLALDASGNLYIADMLNNRIRKVDAQGTITTVVGNGAQGYSGDGGPATSAEISGPSGIVLSSAGNLYIADSGNNRIRKVDAQGTITTVVGNGAQGYSGDGGPATSAEISGPSGIALDRVGNIYISDYRSTVIRKVDKNGVITTVVGNGRTGGYSGDGGFVATAMLLYPGYLAVDSADNLYIADTGNGCIRKVTAPIPSAPWGQKPVTFTVGHDFFTVGGQTITMNAAPFILNGRTMVPVRYLAAALGATTDWDNATETITLFNGDIAIIMRIGSTFLTVNGQSSPMDVAPVIRSDRSYLPALYIAEHLGYTVSWNASAQTVTINPPLF